MMKIVFGAFLLFFMVSCHEPNLVIYAQEDTTETNDSVLINIDSAKVDGANSDSKQNVDTTKADVEIDDPIIVIPPDEQFNIFLCIGQSNMDGVVPYELVDKTNVPYNLESMLIAKHDAAYFGGSRFSWRNEACPLARALTGISVSDYFGRTMLDYLPEGHKIGIVMVAVAGAGIEAFEKEGFSEYYADIVKRERWIKDIFEEYDFAPYQTLIKAAKIAQKQGVIRGILLHQGESNSGQEDWIEKVKTLYDNILTDLNLNAQECPLLVGELLRKENGGVCYAHNDIIAKLPQLVPTAHVISSEGCAGKKSDGMHFLASGLRTMGTRYATTMLNIMGIEIPEKTYNGFVVQDRFLTDNSDNIVTLCGLDSDVSPEMIDKLLNQQTEYNCIRYQIKSLEDDVDYAEFDQAAFKNYLQDELVPILKDYIDNYHLSVVLSPSDYCSTDLKVGDSYHIYLQTLWGIISSCKYIKNNPNIMFDLCPPPELFSGTDKTYNAYFQTIVDIIRVNCQNVIFSPGLADERLCKPYISYPLQSENIGYSVYFSSDMETNWEENVGKILTFAPIIVNGIDFSFYDKTVKKYDNVSSCFSVLSVLNN